MPTASLADEILTPGEGPGGNLLSEGAAHFSTLLLFEQLKGPKARIAFAKTGQVCPLLDEGKERCRIWERRPIACRMHWPTTPAEVRTYSAPKATPVPIILVGWPGAAVSPIAPRTT